jgi:hypothetical protein
MISRNWSETVKLSSLALLAILLSGPVVFAQNRFFEAPGYSVGKQPREVATGDFNQDGNPDLVTANFADNTVSVLLGKVDGTFQAQVKYATGTEPHSVVVGDFNADGKIDLITANKTANTVSVLLGNGDGTLQPHIDYAAGSGGPFFVTAADLNADGISDLVVTHETDNQIAVLLGNGDGSFKSPVNYPVGEKQYSAAIGDFNGDGKLDVAVTNFETDTYSVLLGNGDGTFQAHKDYATGQQPIYLATKDINGDGKLDLMIADFAGNSVAVHLGNGDGTFQAPVYYDSEADSGPNWIFVSDYNGDGKLDMAVSQSNYYGGGLTVAIWLGNGDGTFQQDYLEFGVGPTPFSLIGADFNHDGKMDLATANEMGSSVSILIGNGDGSFRAHRDFLIAPGPSALATGDFNLDGKLDLVASTYTNAATARVLLGNGDGTFQSEMSYVGDDGALGVSVADLNGDGKPDIVLANVKSNDVSVLLGNGDGTFQTHVDYLAGSGPVQVAIADFNGDGKLDFAVADEDVEGPGTVSILLGNGDGTFQTGGEYKVGIYEFGIAAADLNGDGKLDLVAANYGFPWVGNSVSVLLGNGDGTFQPHVDYSTPEDPCSVAIGDFNQDGKPDLVVGSYTGTSILLGNGDGSFQPFVKYANSHGGPVLVADFNGDGKPDVGVGEVGDITVLLGNGDGTLGSFSSYTVIGATGGFVAGDFNGDGALDAVGATPYGSTMSVLLNTGGTFMKMTNTPNPSKQGQAVTFVVSATGSLAGANTPTGSITFKDGSTVLKTVSLHSGRVHYTTSTLSVGTHTITALYSGDHTYNPNQVSVTQVVKSAETVNQP